MLSMVGLTDGVHLMVEIRRQSAAGLNGRDAARAAIDKVGLACFLTSLTTAIGFGSLMLAHHEIVQEFGLSCVLGVVLLFLAVIAVIPQPAVIIDPPHERPSTEIELGATFRSCSHMSA